jgi:tRNA G18 (ribose-2'-O)-methylase SpoU
MRGYFGIGVENISKPMNLGNLMRSAHAFGASFFFTVAANFDAEAVAKSDTAHSAEHVPLYTFDGVDALVLPRQCRLIGVEFDEAAEELPQMRHPPVAAYVLGREKGSLSDAMRARCDGLVTIPTKFCINVGVAGAIVMYDRLISHGRFARRPVFTKGRAEPLPKGARDDHLGDGGAADPAASAADP